MNARTGATSPTARDAEQSSERRIVLSALSETQLPPYQRLRGWASALVTQIWSSDERREELKEAALERAATPDVHLRVNGGVQPELRLADVGEHARLLLLFDHVARAAVLRDQGELAACTAHIWSARHPRQCGLTTQ